MAHLAPHQSEAPGLHSCTCLNSVSALDEMVVAVVDVAGAGGSTVVVVVDAAVG